MDEAGARTGAGGRNSSGRARGEQPGLPYARATSGERARVEIRKLLQRFGCESVGFMDEFAEGTLLLAFVYRGQQVQLKVSGRGWANQYLKLNPWHNRRRCSKETWERQALAQGMLATSSILRDWVKGQVTAIETGIIEFRHVFLPYLVTGTGETVAELVDRRGGAKVLELPGSYSGAD